MRHYMALMCFTTTSCWANMNYHLTFEITFYVIWCYKKTNKLKLNMEHIKLDIILLKWITISRYLVLLFLLHVPPSLISEAKMSVDHRGCRGATIYDWLMSLVETLTKQAVINSAFHSLQSHFCQTTQWLNVGGYSSMKSTLQYQVFDPEASKSNTFTPWFSVTDTRHESECLHQI